MGKVTITEAREIDFEAAFELRQLLTRFGVWNDLTKKLDIPSKDNPNYSSWKQCYNKIYNPLINWRPNGEKFAMVSY
jgi:hypothetical protein